MFIYTIRLIVATYFIIYYKRLLKPDIVKMVTINQEDYLVKLKRTQLDGEIQLGTAIMPQYSIPMEDQWSKLFLTFNRIAFCFQIAILLSTYVLVSNEVYRLFLLTFIGVQSLEHIIMNQFYRDQATSFMMYVDRVIFVINYIAYAMIILALIFL